MTSGVRQERDSPSSFALADVDNSLFAPVYAAPEASLADA